MHQTPRTRQRSGGTGAILISPGAAQPDSPGRAARRPTWVQVISGGLDDAVLRRKRFERAYPQVVITPPGIDTCLWAAHRDGALLATGYQLSVLLDTLGRLLGTQL
jgi:hypothetical protein